MIVQVPTPLSEREDPDTAATAVLDVTNVTGSPEVEVAEIERGLELIETVFTAG